jgi:hypothetical protein
VRLARITLLALLICGVALGENAEESVRAYADKMAMLISQSKEDELLEQFVTGARAVSDKSSLLKPLADLRRVRGAILKYEYRNMIHGRTMFPGEVLPTLTFWYALESERGVENDFLTITIAPAGANLGLVSFRLATIVGPLPGFLKPEQHE